MCALMLFIFALILFCTCSMTAATQVPFFGRHMADDRRSIRSSLDRAYEKYKREISTCLQQVWRALSEMEDANAILPELTDIHDDFHKTAQQLSSLWSINDDLINTLTMNKTLSFIYAIPQGPCYPYFFEGKAQASYESLSQLLVHLSRDWADKGATTREKIYHNGILAALRHMFPSDATSPYFTANRHVLVPGAGLGRLALEIAAMGFRYALMWISYVGPRKDSLC